jgi:hypothetical protein
MTPMLQEWKLTGKRMEHLQFDSIKEKLRDYRKWLNKNNINFKDITS